MYPTCYKHVFLQYGFNGTLFSKIRWANQKLFGENWFCTVSWKLHILENLFFRKVVIILHSNIFMEEVICWINPANSDLFAGLIRQIVAYLPD